MSGLVLQTPWALALLALPALLLWLARSRSRPAQVATGSFELWRRLGAQGRTSAQSLRQRPPARLWALCAALALCALALSAPEPKQARAASELWVAVERGPALLLPWYDPETGADAGISRLERALEQAAPALQAAREAGARVRWCDERGEAWAGPLDQQPEPAWFAAATGRAFDHQGLDQPHLLWLSTGAWRSERALPQLAGLALSGGAAVPGLVGRAGGYAQLYDGGEHVRRGERLPAKAAIEGAPAAALEQLFRFWCAEQALELLPGASPDSACVLRAAEPTAASHTLEGGRDGWAAALQVGGPLRAEAGWTTWLAAADGEPLVRWRTGVIETNLLALTPLGGDPAALAVSCSELFEAALRAPPGLVGLADRRGAGESLARPAPGLAQPAQVRAAVQRGARWQSLLLVASAVAALVALLLALGAVQLSLARSGSSSMRP